MAVEGENDATLIQAAQKDSTSFGTLFDRHFGTVYGGATRERGGNWPEDIAGETFRRAFEARRSYDLHQPNALPWLFRIALNLVRDAIRARAAEDRAYARLRALGRTGTLSEEDQVPRSAEARTELARLARLLDAEPQEDVDALFLHVWDGLSYVEVATALGVPVGTVRSRLSRLRQRLETTLVNQVGDSQESHLKAKE